MTPLVIILSLIDRTWSPVGKRLLLASRPPINAASYKNRATGLGKFTENEFGGTVQYRRCDLTGSVVDLLET